MQSSQGQAWSGKLKLFKPYTSVRFLFFFLLLLFSPNTGPVSNCMPIFFCISSIVANLLFCSLRVVSLSALTVDAEDVLDEAKEKPLTELWFVFLKYLMVCHYDFGSVEIILLFMYVLNFFFYIKLLYLNHSGLVSSLILYFFLFLWTSWLFTLKDKLKN